MLSFFKQNILRFFIASLLLFFTFSFLYRTDNSFDQDLGRHLKLGEIILKEGRIPDTNLFSYTNPDFPFINHHYLFEVLVFLGQQTTGLEFILWLKILLFLSAVSFTLLVVPGKNLFFLLPIGFIFLHILRERTELRPEIVSFLFTALTLFTLTRFEKTKSKLLYLLPLIQLFWINTHIYFPVGFILQGIFILHLLVNRKKPLAKTLFWILLTSLAVSLINPNHVKGLLYPLNIFGNYGYTIAENQSIFLLESLGLQNPNFLFVKIAAGLTILSLFVGAKRRALSLKNLLLSLAGLMFALMNVRSFPYLVFLALPAVAENFGPVTRFKLSALILAIFTPLLILESALYLNGSYYRQTDTAASPRISHNEHGKGALDFVLANNLPQPIFNNFDIGSYIIYRAYPDYKVFVDGRPESYPRNFFREVYIPMQNNKEIFGARAEEYNLQSIIFSHTDQTPWGRNFLSFITKDPGWTTVYLDDFMIILVRSEAARDMDLPAVDFSTLSPKQYDFDNHLSYLHLSLFLLNRQQTRAALSFAQDAHSLAPKSYTANLIFGQEVEKPWW